MLVFNSYLGMQFPCKAQPGLAIDQQRAERPAPRARAGLQLPARSLRARADGSRRRSRSTTTAATSTGWTSSSSTSLRRRSAASRARMWRITSADAGRASTLPSARRTSRLRKDLPSMVGHSDQADEQCAGRRVVQRGALRARAGCDLRVAPEPAAWISSGSITTIRSRRISSGCRSGGTMRAKSRSFHDWIMNSVTAKWWDWSVLPSGLRFFCKHYAGDFDRPILIAENGMALRRRFNNEHFPRKDKLTRSEFIRAHVNEVERLVGARGSRSSGTCIGRCSITTSGALLRRGLGLFALDYQKGTERLAVDFLGDCPRRPMQRWSRKPGREGKPGQFNRCRHMPIPSRPPLANPASLAGLQRRASSRCKGEVAGPLVTSICQLAALWRVIAYTASNGTSWGAGGKCANPGSRWSVGGASRCRRRARAAGPRWRGAHRAGRWSRPGSFPNQAWSLQRPVAALDRRRASAE